MNQEQLDFQERINSETSKTGHEEFDKNGYLFVKDLWDPKELFCVPPVIPGQYNYHGSLEKFSHEPIEGQVYGSTSRYSYPPYKFIHSQIRMKIEKIIGKKLYNTYYYDRFYNPGQGLDKHADRAACEISVTLHISNNLSNSLWPIWIKTPDTYKDELRTDVIEKGEDRSLILGPGDGMIYKGCERPHWREPLPKEYKEKKWYKWYKEEEEKEDLYYHQVFFHYVLADGLRAHFAGDMSS
jgi:hypothetical protein